MNDFDKIQMQGIHVELTPALQRTILNKFQHVVRHASDVIRVNVQLHKDQTLGRGYHFRATAQVERTGADLIVESEGEDAYLTLEQLADHAIDMLAREHGRKRALRRQSAPPFELATGLPKP